MWAACCKGPVWHWLLLGIQTLLTVWAAEYRLRQHTAKAQRTRQRDGQHLKVDHVHQNQGRVLMRRLHPRLAARRNDAVAVVSGGRDALRRGDSPARRRLRGHQQRGELPRRGGDDQDRARGAAPAETRTTVSGGVTRRRHGQCREALQGKGSHMKLPNLLREPLRIPSSCAQALQASVRLNVHAARVRRNPASVHANAVSPARRHLRTATSTARSPVARNSCSPAPGAAPASSPSSVSTGRGPTSAGACPSSACGCTGTSLRASAVRSALRGSRLQLRRAGWTIREGHSPRLFSAGWGCSKSRREAFVASPALQPLSDNNISQRVWIAMQRLTSKGYGDHEAHLPWLPPPFWPLLLRVVAGRARCSHARDVARVPVEAAASGLSESSSSAIELCSRSAAGKKCPASQDRKACCIGVHAIM